MRSATPPRPVLAAVQRRIAATRSPVERASSPSARFDERVDLRPAQIVGRAARERDLEIRQRDRDRRAIAAPD